jgi:hypothetical protein
VKILRGAVCGTSQHSENNIYDERKGRKFILAKMSKKIKYLVSLLLFLLWFQGVNANLSQAIVNTGQVVVCWVTYALFALVLILVVGAGYQVATSGGDPGRLESAKRLLIFAAIGALIVYWAPWMVQQITGSPYQFTRCF